MSFKININDTYSDFLQHGTLPKKAFYRENPNVLLRRALENGDLKFELIEEEQNMNTEEQLEKTLQALGIYMKENNKKCIEAFENFLNVVKETEDHTVQMPKGLKEYYKINFGKVENVWCTNDSRIDRAEYESGGLYQIEEQAEWELKKRKLIFKIEDWAVNTYGSELTLDWGNKYIPKYYIYKYEHKLEIGTLGLLRIPMLLPYFATEEQARECIEKFGDEILEVLF